LHHYGALEASQEYSSRVLGGLRTRLTDGLSSNVEAVAMAGSFGRLEGSTSSDADYILVVKNASDPAIEQDKNFIQESIKALGALPPNKSGVFSAPRTEAELVQKLGRPEEPTDVLGKRMLLLLE